MTAVIAVIEKQIDEIEAAIVETIAAEPLLRTRHALLVSIPGIGTLSAAIILVEM